MNYIVVIDLVIIDCMYKEFICIIQVQYCVLIEIDVKVGVLFKVFGGDVGGGKSYF